MPCLKCLGVVMGEAVFNAVAVCKYLQLHACDIAVPSLLTSFPHGNTRLVRNARAACAGESLQQGRRSLQRSCLTMMTAHLAHLVPALMRTLSVQTPFRSGNVALC